MVLTRPVEVAGDAASSAATVAARAQRVDDRGDARVSVGLGRARRPSSGAAGVRCSAAPGTDWRCRDDQRLPAPQRTARRSASASRRRRGAGSATRGPSAGQDPGLPPRRAHAQGRGGALHHPVSRRYSRAGARRRLRAARLAGGPARAHRRRRPGDLRFAGGVLAGGAASRAGADRASRHPRARCATDPDSDRAQRRLSRHDRSWPGRIRHPIRSGALGCV